MSLLGAAAQYASAKALQEDAQKFQVSFYEQRYQRQMADMRLAGLNPILSYKTGVPGGTTAGIASTTGIAEAVGKSISRPFDIAKTASAKQLLDEQHLTQQEMTRTQRQIGIKTAQEAQNAVYEGAILEGRVPAAGITAAFDVTPAGRTAIQVNRALGSGANSAANVLKAVRMRR